MEKNRRKIILPFVALLMGGALAAVWAAARDGRNTGTLATSGAIEATDVPVAAEVAGKVTDVLVEEGQRVRPTRRVCGFWLRRHLHSIGWCAHLALASFLLT